MTEKLERIRDLIQEDVGNRGLRRQPHENPVTYCTGDFERACRSLAEHPRPWLAIVTGFYIPTANPPAGETDGPLGALFLARALEPLGYRVVIATDDFCLKAMEAGVAAAGLKKTVNVFSLPTHHQAQKLSLDDYWDFFRKRAGNLTHLLALERVGPSHTLATLQMQLGGEGLGETYLDFVDDVPDDHQDRCHTMRGVDITETMSPAHWLFEMARVKGIPTIGIGDGGNEIGMGKIPWHILRANIPRGGLVACRVPTDHLIVAGISNWGAYGLAAGIRLLRGSQDPSLFLPEQELNLLKIIVDAGPLVDGVTGQVSATVDGLNWERYSQVLVSLMG